MKFVTVFILVVAFVSAAIASTGFIDDAKVQDCSSGTCIDVCQFDGLKIHPGSEVNNDGKCRRIRCTKDFSVQITSCSANTSLEKCKKYKDNSKLSFPKCCENTCKY